MRDIDGNVYKTVTIGSQTWTVENLKVTRYNDGTPIPHVIDVTEWSNLSTPALCWSWTGKDTSRLVAGALYNWYAVETGNLAPEGWHVPTDADWQELEDYLIANGYNWDGSTSGDKIAKSLAAQTDWSSSSEAGDVGNDITSNNSTGFSALPWGYRSSNGGFNFDTVSAKYWAFRPMSPIIRELNGGHEGLLKFSSHTRCGYHIRLIKDY